MQRVKVEVKSSELRQMPNAWQVVQNDVDGFVTNLALKTKDGEMLTVIATYTREPETTDELTPEVAER